MYSRVYVEITNICNMHCSFCHGHARPPRRMSIDEFSRVLDALDGQTQFVYYHLMGEPLTHPDLPKMIDMASARGFRSVITTNGTLLSRRKSELIAAHPHKISISVHSFEDGTEQAFDDYLRAITDFADAAASAGIIVVFRLWNKGFDGGRNSRIEAFLRQRLAGEWTPNSRGIRIRDKLHLEWGERFAWPDKQAPLQGNEVFCYGLGDHFGILSDGTVVPCCLDSDGIITLGNVLEQPLSEILSSPRARAITEGFARRTASEDLCRRCAYAQRFV